MELAQTRRRERVGDGDDLVAGLDAPTKGTLLVLGGSAGDPAIRARVLERLGWLGCTLDSAANAAHGPLISTGDSRLKAYVVPTNEELMIARHTLRTLRGQG